MCQRSHGGKEQKAYKGLEEDRGSASEHKSYRECKKMAEDSKVLLFNIKSLRVYPLKTGHP